LFEFLFAVAQLQQIMVDADANEGRITCAKLTPIRIDNFQLQGFSCMGVELAQVLLLFSQFFTPPSVPRQAAESSVVSPPSCWSVPPQDQLVCQR
jgi:hypothetical protein